MRESIDRRMRYAGQNLAYTVLVVVAIWNIWAFGQKSLRDLPKRDADDVVITEDRYRNIRSYLIETGYKGPISFVTNRDLQSQPATAEDYRQWAQGQYVMAPWVLLRGGADFSGHKVPGDPVLVIGDFWDGKPVRSPEGLTEVYDSGRSLSIYRRTQQQ